MNRLWIGDVRQYFQHNLPFFHFLQFHSDGCSLVGPEISQRQERHTHFIIGSECVMILIKFS